ncbi:MAG: hypothetical protein LBP83_08305 [Dysgonamonadaceae bacterium]|jgi:hypothetical protein|nr:hypothetical protein [Dysgonamonadaceae bacterium]
MDTKKIFLSMLLIVSALFAGCERNDAPDNGNGTENPEDAPLYALDISEETEWDYMIASEEGSCVFFDIDRQTNIPTNMVIKPLKDNDYAFTVTFKDNGQPDMAIFGDTIVVFENFTDSTVDIAIIYPSIVVKYFYNIDISGANDIRIENQSPQLRAVSPETKVAFEHGVKFIFSAAKIVVAVVGVGAAVTAAGGPVLIGAAVASGIFTFVGILNDYYQWNIGIGIGSASGGHIANLVGCAISASNCVLNLAMDYLSAGYTALEYAKSRKELTDMARAKLQQDHNNGNEGGGNNGGNEGGGDNGGDTTEEALIGTWMLTINEDGETFNGTLVLKENGIASAPLFLYGNGTWNINGNNIRIHFAGEDGISTTLYGTLDFSETYISGTCIDVWAHYDENGNFDYNETHYGTFTMSKGTEQQNMPALKKQSSKGSKNYKSIFNNK